MYLFFLLFSFPLHQISSLLLIPLDHIYHTFILVNTRYDTLPVRPSVSESTGPPRVGDRAYTAIKSLALFLRFIASGISSDDQVMIWGGCPATRSRYINCIFSNLSSFLPALLLPPFSFSLSLLFYLSSLLFDNQVTLSCLVAALKHWEPAHISLPSIAQAQVWARQIENYEPHIRGCFGVADGMLIPLQNDGRYSIQRLYYNGMDVMHAVKQINVFGIDGTLIAYGSNYPSSFGDSRCTYVLEYVLGAKMSELKARKSKVSEIESE